MAKSKGIQIGNFLVTKEGYGTEFIKVASMSNNWSMKFREDNPQFKFIQVCANDKNKHDFLEAMIKLNYCMNNAVMDMEFMNEFLVVYKGLNERNEAKQLALSGVSDEEDQAIIEEQRRIYEEQHKPKEE